MTPSAAARPNALPPVSKMACARPAVMPGRSASVPRVPGAPPRTSTPGTAPPGTSTTVQPVRPAGSVQCPTDTPPGSGAVASGWFAIRSASWRRPRGAPETVPRYRSMIAGPAPGATAGALVLRRRQGGPPPFFYNDPAATEIYTLSLHDVFPPGV